jgi:hypothetical protein
VRFVDLLLTLFFYVGRERFYVIEKHVYEPRSEKRVYDRTSGLLRGDPQTGGAAAAIVLVAGLQPGRSLDRWLVDRQEVNARPDFYAV